MFKNLLSSFIFCFVIGAILWLKWKTKIFTLTGYIILLILISLSYIAGSIIDPVHLKELENKVINWLSSLKTQYKVSKEKKILASKNINSSFVPPV